MKGSLVLGIALCAVFGCTDREKADVQVNAAVAWASAREAASTAWSAFSREFAKVSSESSRTALEAAKKQGEALQRQLAEVKVESPLTAAQGDAVRAQMEKIEAALTVKNLQEQSQTAVQNAIAAGTIAKDNYEAASLKLSELSDSYRELQQKLESAKSTFDQASKQTDKALNQVRELTKQN